MRISATSAAVTRDAPAPRRAVGAGFSLADGAGTAARASFGQLHSIGSIDTLVALQGLEDTTEKRRRAVVKGRGALDALDRLKVGLLSGDLDGSALRQLQSLTGEFADTTGDAGLDSVLAEIDLRVQVEIAKLSRR